MATILEDLAVFLPAYTPTLTLTFGTNLFAGLLPNEPDVATAMFEYPGGQPDYVYGAGNPLPPITRPNIQVVTRDVDYVAGRSNIENICRALETVSNQTINGTLYYRIVRQADPSFMHRDVNRRVFFVVNMLCERRPS